jgi:uncharacterized protein (TIGR02145 family)
MKRLSGVQTCSVAIISALLMLSGGCKKTEDEPVKIPATVTDIDGNVYHTIAIGTQVWTVENLRVTRYNDGTAIPLVTDSASWGNLKAQGYCWYDNNESAYKNSYGALYNGYVIGSGKLAPAGWHIPTDAEWAVLTAFLGGEDVAGNKLKEAGSDHWSIMNTDATNASGFTALPGGYRYSTGQFIGISTVGFWWSSTAYGYGYKYRYMYDNDSKVESNNINKELGHSIRCIMD